MALGKVTESNVFFQTPLSVFITAIFVFQPDNLSGFVTDTQAELDYTQTKRALTMQSLVRNPNAIPEGTGRRASRARNPVPLPDTGRAS